MLDPITGFVGGTLGGAVQDIVKGRTKKTIEGYVPEDGDENPIHQRLDKIIILLEEFLELQRPETTTPIELVIPVTQFSDYPLDRHGRKYMMIFVGANTTFVFNVPGLGNIQLALTVGWNTMNLPSGTRLSLVSGNTATVNVIFRADDQSYGTAI